MIVSRIQDVYGVSHRTYLGSTSSLLYYCVEQSTSIRPGETALYPGPVYNISILICIATVPMHQPAPPFALIHSPVSPFEYSVAFLHVVNIRSNILPFILPLK